MMTQRKALLLVVLSPVLAPIVVLGYGSILLLSVPGIIVAAAIGLAGQDIVADRVMDCVPISLIGRFMRNYRRDEP